MMNDIIKDIDIEAFIDKELNEKDEKEILIRLEQDAAKRKVYRNIFRQKLLLREWWKNHI